MKKNNKQIEAFCKDITDFIILHQSGCIGIGSDLISSSDLEYRWMCLQEKYKSIPNKTHDVTDIWKKLSSLISKSFLRNKKLSSRDISVAIAS